MQQHGTHLTQLAADANREHFAALAAASAALGHAIAAGEALLAAREAVPRGQWERWVHDNFRSPTMARPYMRLARYKHLLPEDRDLSQVDALRLLRGLPGTTGNAPASEVAVLRDEGLRLLDAGFAEREVCRILGVGRGTIHRWKTGAVDGDSPTRLELKRERAERRRRRRQATVALRALNGTTDGELEQAHDLLVEASRILRDAVRREVNEEAKGAIVDALTRLALVEDDVRVASHLHNQNEAVAA